MGLMPALQKTAIRLIEEQVLLVDQWIKKQALHLEEARTAENKSRKRKQELSRLEEEIDQMRL